MKKKTRKIKKYITIIIIVNKKHENVVKNWLCPNFLLLLQKNGGLQPPPHPPFLKRISSSSSKYVVLTFLGEKKIYPLP